MIEWNFCRQKRAQVISFNRTQFSIVDLPRISLLRYKKMFLNVSHQTLKVDLINNLNS